MKILPYLNSTRDLGITYTKGEELSLTVYTGSDYASKETDRRSILDVVVMLRNAAVYAKSCTQLCVTLSVTGRVRSACRGGQGEDACSIGYVFHAAQRVRNHFDGGQRGSQGNVREPP